MGPPKPPGVMCLGLALAAKTKPKVSENRLGPGRVPRVLISTAWPSRGCSAFLHELKGSVGTQLLTVKGFRRKTKYHIISFLGVMFGVGCRSLALWQVVSLQGRGCDCVEAFLYKWLLVAAWESTAPA